MASPNGKSIASFRVEEEIGQGGMGVVLRARQDTLDRTVVLKKLRRELADQPELLERFRRESRAAAAVHHHNVVGVYDFFPWRGDHYIAQEYVDGVDLRAALERTGPLPWRIAGLVALEAARGLEEIHAAGTVHRDLKPANVLLGRRGDVKIADFGIALEASGAPLTQPGVAIGSPAYMSPEQMMGERLDARSDLFSLAVVVYEMLTGAAPHARAPRPDGEGDDDDTLLARMRGERYPRLRSRAPDTPRFLARLVRSGLRARPRRRLATTRDLRRRLERGLGHPSSADARSEIAAWLWSAHVFERRESETLVQVAAAPGGAPRTLWRTWALAAACVAVFASVLLVDIRHAPPPEMAIEERAAPIEREAQEEPAPREPETRPDDLPGEAQAPSRVRTLPVPYSGGKFSTALGK